LLQAIDAIHANPDIYVMWAQLWRGMEIYLGVIKWDPILIKEVTGIHWKALAIQQS